MNISGISSTQAVQPSNTLGNVSRNQLLDEQKELVSSVLEEYDASSLSAEDASEIVASFQEAGIKPSRDLANTMREAGFSASEVGELAGVAKPEGGMPPPPPPQDSSEEEYAISTLLETLLNTKEEEDEDSSSSYSNVSDYTSRIMSLNEDVKQQIKELFESYKPENTNLSSQDASKVVASSLGQILGDSNNYSSTSYYA